MSKYLNNVINTWYKGLVEEANFSLVDRDYVKIFILS